MAFWELMLLAVGLSMDAFAVAICKGLAMDKVTLQRAAVVGLWFGGFQGLMPLLGWLLGSRFAAYITAVDHWIAFALLVLLGINMIREARCPDEEDTNASLAFRVMLPMAVATSIDAWPWASPSPSWRCPFCRRCASLPPPPSYSPASG